MEAVGNASPAQCAHMFRPHDGCARQRQRRKTLPHQIRQRLTEST